MTDRYWKQIGRYEKRGRHEAVVAGIIELPDGMSDEQVQAIKERFAEKVRLFNEGRLSLIRREPGVYEYV